MISEVWLLLSVAGVGEVNIRTPESDYSKHSRPVTFGPFGADGKAVGLGFTGNGEHNVRLM